MFLIEALKVNPKLIEEDIIKQFREENPGFNKQIERTEKEQKLSTLKEVDNGLDKEISEARGKLEVERNESSRND